MSTTPSPQGSPAIAPEPEKPIKSKQVGLMVIGILVVLAVLLEVIVSVFSTSSATPQGQIPQPPQKSEVEGFPEAVKRQAGILKTNKEKAEKALEETRVTIGALPECDAGLRAKLNGRLWTVRAKDGSTPDEQFACGDDNNWMPVAASANQIQPPTAAQYAAQQRFEPDGQARGASAQERAQAAAQKRKAALDAALNSSSVALHFAPKESGTTVPGAGQSDQESAARLAQHQRETRDQAITAEGGTLSQPEDPAARSGRSSLPENVEEEPTAIEASDKKNKYPWDEYDGQLYRTFEGNLIETILLNRLQGEYTGPVKVQVSTNVYSFDRQHILIPQGTIILGESRRVNSSGQRRLQVTFHRIIMPDGWSVDLSKFEGLDQQGAAGLTGRVDTHWKSLVATAVMVGAIEGLAQPGIFGGATTGGIVEVQSGMSQQAGQTGMQILQSATNKLPTVTVYEGTRIRIWTRSDFQLPAYERHKVAPNL